MKKISDNKILKVKPDFLNYFSEPPNWWWFNQIDKRIKFFFFKNLLRKFALNKKFYGGNWDAKAISFEKTHWFNHINNFKENISKPENSLWYKLIVKEINSRGYYLHKKIKIKNEDDIFNFFENYLIKLINSLKYNQFILENDDDVPQVLIGRNGKLIKSAHGCHRLAIIKSFNINCDFPIKIIGVHKKFRLNNFKKLNNFDEVLNYVKNNYSNKKP